MKPIKKINIEALKKLNDDELLEFLQTIMSSYSDFIKYTCQCYALIEDFDETREWYDVDEWFFNDNAIMQCIASSFEDAANDLDLLEIESSQMMWDILEYIKEEKTYLFRNTFKFDPENVSLSNLREYIEDKQFFINMEKGYTIPENAENVIRTIKIGYDDFCSEKFKYNERPFFNDNFAVLKILKDHQTIIKNEKFILLSQKDISNISGFNLNKVQNIMTMLIEWNYLKTVEKGKYKLTKEGNDMIEALMKIPPTKIVK